VTRIQRINIVGAKAFTEGQLLSEITLTTPAGSPGTRRTTSTASRSSAPTSRRCAASTRTAATSSSRRVDPGRDHARPREHHDHVNINEGPRYTVSDVRLAGELAVEEPELRRLIRVKPGETFSRSRLQASAKTSATGSARRATRSRT